MSYQQEMNIYKSNKILKIICNIFNISFQSSIFQKYEI